MSLEVKYQYEQLDRFLKILCGDSEPTFQTFPDCKGQTGGSYAQVLHGNTPAHRATLADLNGKGAGCFIMVNEGDGIIHEADPGNKNPTTCRNGHNVIRIRSVFADLDGSPLQPVLETGFTPHMVIESSPGRFHVYWLVSDCVIEQFTPIQKAIAKRFNGDPSVNDLPRVMRLPDFLHQKNEPYRTQFLEARDSLPVYTVNQIIDGLCLMPFLDDQPKGKQSKTDDSYKHGSKEGGRTNGITKVARSQSRRGFSENENIQFCLTHDSLHNVPPLEQTHPGKVAAIVTDIYERYVKNDADAIPDYVVDLNKDHFIARDGSKTVVCREVYNSELVRTSFTDFTNFFSNRIVQIIKPNMEVVFKPLGKAYLESPFRRQYEGIGMFPEGDRPGYYNLFKGYSVKSVNGSWKLMRRHIFEVICDSDDKLYQYLLRWLARMFQQPGTPGEVAIVLKGGRGTGKGAFINALCKIMGLHAVHVTNSKHITGNFNAHLEGCILLFADESFFAGDRQADNVMKGLVTEPVIPIERKGFDLKTVPNMLHIMMASNSSWIIPAGLDERRYCVLNVSDCYKQNLEYFADLISETENGGLEAMLFDLLAMDLDGFNVRAVPATVGLVEQKIQSLDPVMSWWFQKLQDAELLDSHEWEPAPFPKLYDDYIISVQRLGGNIRRATESGFARLLRKALPPEWPKDSRIIPHNAPYGNQKRVRHYEFPSLEICRGHFEQLLGGEKYEW